MRWLQTHAELSLSCVVGDHFGFARKVPFDIASPVRSTLSSDDGGQAFQEKENAHMKSAWKAELEQLRH